MAGFHQYIISVGMVAALIGLPPYAAAQDNSGAPPVIDWALYGSLRVQANYASVDNASAGQDNSFLGLTDAYSRLGARIGTGNDDLKISAHFELNVNSADLELGDPAFFDDEDERLYALKASGKFGTVTVGKDWLPYYNNVGYPVDYFSSVYAGYSTYAYFRELQIGYVSPTIGGMTGSLARIKRTGGGANGWHYILSYSGDKFTVAAGREDMDGLEADTQGASISFADGDFYGAFKYENNDAFGDIFNVFGQYTRGDLTYKAGIGLGDQFAGNSYHLGIDYKITDRFKLFYELYSEERNYAILADGAERASDYLGAGGFGAQQNGKALLAGFRFDFSTAQ